MPYLLRSLMGRCRLRDGTGSTDPVYPLAPSTREAPGAWVPFRHLPKGMSDRGDRQIQVRAISDEDYAKAMAGTLEVVGFVGEKQVTEPVVAPAPTNRSEAPKPPAPEVVTPAPEAPKPATMAATVDQDQLAAAMGARQGENLDAAAPDPFASDTDESATEPSDKPRTGGRRRR